MTPKLSFSLKRFVTASIFLLPPILAYLYFVRQLDFIQDDAYITFRYVTNFLNGDGLVFNIGERVEGFTNFGWTVFLILVGALKSDFIAVSKITGTIFGAGVIILTFLTARLLFKPEDQWFAFFPPYLLGANMALAYWSQSGLETGAFAFMSVLSFYLFLKRSWWLIIALTLAVWLRPEGALVTAIFILTEAIVEKRLPKYSLLSAASAFVLSIPFVLFKFFYFGSILPNSFYAKTGMSLEQVVAGLDYSWLFLKHYGFYGAGIILPILFWKKLDDLVRSVLLFTLFYLAYVVLIGGDVLKVHRFFLPIFGLSAILISHSLSLLVRKLKFNGRNLILFISIFPLTWWTYSSPRELIWHYRDSELGLVLSLQGLAKEMKKTDSTDFSVALTTIGAFSYELVGHKVIDMLGLTDTTIARHPEAPIKELETTWREQNFNASYVLARKPDYIVFSTGVKPSAPAEQALLLYTQFINSYKVLVWFVPGTMFKDGGMNGVAFKKVNEVAGDLKPTYPPKYVRLFKSGRELQGTGRHERAITTFDSAMAISPRPYYTDLVFAKALSFYHLHQPDSAKFWAYYILDQDSLVLDAHKMLYIYAVESGDSVVAALHRKWLEKIAPWYWPRLDFEVHRAVFKTNINES